MNPHPDLRLDTLLQHFAEEDKPHGAVVPPIFQNSLFLFKDCDELWSALENPSIEAPYLYSRLTNPTLEIVERKIAMLEGMEAAKVFGGGMAAISVGVLSAVESGAHAVVVDTCYGPTRMLFEEFLSRFGVSATFVDGRCHEDVIDNIRPETRLIYLESPSSVVFRLQDLERIGAAAKEKGVTTICDNTCATPLFQSPARYGIDMVVHSASKYLSGHSDITAGVLCCNRDRMKGLLCGEVGILASTMAPFPAWLLLRGLRTLPIRMKAHQESGNAIAGFLEDRPEVERVFHAGLPSHPQKELFARQMRGSSSLLSFIPKIQDREYVRRFVNSLRIFGIGVSWGGFESLVVPLQFQPIDWPEPRWVIRFHVGLEDSADLMEDMGQAFAAANESPYAERS